MRQINYLLITSQLFVFLWGLDSIVYADLNEGLVGYYPFNGNANDESGSGNNGTANGAILTSDRFGIVDSAYFFDGIADFISVPNSSSLVLLDDLTITAWINLSSISQEFQIIARKGEVSAGTGASSYAFYIRSFDELAFYFTGGSIHQTNTLNVSADTWYHVAVSFDNGSNLVRIFLNGERVYDATESSTPVEYDYPFGIGRTNDPGQYFGGVIDEVRLYNRALTQEEIQELSNDILTLNVTIIGNDVQLDWTELAGGSVFYTIYYKSELGSTWAVVNDMLPPWLHLNASIDTFKYFYSVIPVYQ